MTAPISLLAAICFTIAMALKKFGFERSGETFGVAFHILLLPVVAILPATDWSQAAGYAWLAVDIAIGVAALNNLRHDSVWPIRLGGHVLAGLWIVDSSLFMPGWLRLVGVALGIYLGGYSFLAYRLSPKYLIPTGVLMLVWLTGIAFSTQ